MVEWAPDGLIHVIIALMDVICSPLFSVLIAEVVDSDGSARPVGFAMVHSTYSSWKGHCLHLEDLYLEPEYRRGGIGTMLIATVSVAAQVAGAARVTWVALDWNEPALRCYRQLKAEELDEWISFRIGRQDILSWMTAIEAEA